MYEMTEKVVSEALAAHLKPIWSLLLAARLVDHDEFLTNMHTLETEAPNELARVVARLLHSPSGLSWR